MERFLECNEDVRFDIGAAFRRRFPSTEPAESRTSAPAAEECFEEIAESRSAKFKLNPAAAIAAPLLKSTTRLTAPLRRRLKSTGLVPVRAELIVFLALLRIAQDFVGFIDLLEFFFGGFFVLGHVRMLFPRKFAKRAPDFVLGRGFRNPKRFVIISELHCHRASNLVPPINSRNLLPACAKSGNF